ncbi:LD-carboxypeptidase [Jejudonia soesokkakensis]|uniref:LD-carboxypeptidase n=1 Tax=Jejudonia soesokkakensis TaxID=1323432 RepID=A0ABW2MVB6_9FLAO
MIIPPKLTQGATVAIISTARKITKKELRPALDLLSEWGLNVVLGKTIGAACDQFAGDDSLRTEDLQQMLDNPQIKAVWFARGGYGTVRIIDSIDFSAFKKTPKWLIGYSDITVLHSHIHNLGIETLHAQMPLEIEKRSAESASSIQEVLFGKEYTIKFSSESVSGNRNGTAKGQLIGGNLSILYSLCGSNSSLPTDGKILFLEDLDEYLYHIDRMLQNLKRNGMLKGLAGLIVGGMSDMSDNTIPFGKTTKEIIMETVSAYDYPVCFDFPAGHVKDNRALIMGRTVLFSVDNNKVQLKF